MTQHEESPVQQQYHELLGDAKELLLLLVPLPIKVDLVFGIIFGSIEALVLEAQGRGQVTTDTADAPTPDLTDATDRHSKFWNEVQAASQEVGQARPSTPARRPVDPVLAALDGRADRAIAALRVAISNAKQIAKILAETPPGHRLPRRILDELGRLLTAIDSHSSDLSQVIDQRASAVSVPRHVLSDRAEAESDPRTALRRLRRVAHIATDVHSAPDVRSTSISAPYMRQASPSPNVDDSRRRPTPPGRSIRSI